jgi:hypothetical protein
LTATSIIDHASIQRGADRLCRQAEALIDAVSNRDTATGPTDKSSLELIVDGYAHVLVLDVDRLRLEREIARMVEIGDPGMAGKLSELSTLLRRMTHASEVLRGRLSELRAQLEAHG